MRVATEKEEDRRWVPVMGVVSPREQYQLKEPPKTQRKPGEQLHHNREEEGLRKAPTLAVDRRPRAGRVQHQGA